MFVIEIYIIITKSYSTCWQKDNPHPCAGGDYPLQWEEVKRMHIPYAVGKEYPPIILINRMMRGYPYREGMDIPIEELIGCADNPTLSTEDT